MENDEFFKSEKADGKASSSKSADSGQAKKPAAEREQSSSKKQATGGDGSFNSLNPDDLDMEEFEHFVDEEEFEGDEFRLPSSKESSTAKPGDSSSQQRGAPPSKGDNKPMPSLKIADVPMHLMSNGNWQNYVWEIVLLVIISIYMGNFFYGKSKNYRLVNHWFQSHRAILEKNFALVGDDGTTTELPKHDENEIGTLIKESENSYALWCTGRLGCDGMLIQLKLIKRQDLINGLMMQFLKPQSDQIIISVEYPNPDEVDSFVFCLCNKKISQQMFNDYQDLSTYCLEKKTLPASSASVDHKYVDLLNANVASRYSLLNELGEVPNNVLDKSVCAFLNKYPEMVEYLLISDQYVGYKAQMSEDQSPSGSATNGADATGASQGVGIPKSRSIFVLCLNVGGKGLGTTVEDIEKMQPAIHLAMYLIDRVPRVRLSKEAKLKAIKKRKDVAEQFMKLTHKQRQEAAMLRKEEKRRAEKEKIMNESDPEKQKRLEEKELKREKRKNLSKMKQIKIKAM